MDHIKLTTDKLDINEITELVSSPSCGAVSIFVGMTRDNFENKQVVQLEYEAYETMAEKAVKKLCEDMRHKWEVHNIAIFHRLGIVPVKETSIVIAVSSPHRVASLESVQFAIDNFKASVPIWKKEVYADQPAEWKSNRESFQHHFTNTVPGTDTTVPVVENDITPELIQLKTSSAEISRRIAAFIESKRKQVNLSNIQDFCYHRTDVDNTEEVSSCARVDALLICRKDSNSHLRVRRVTNAWGPQTRTGEPQPKKSPEPEQRQNISRNNCPFGIAERMKNVEEHLGMGSSVPMTIYERLKAVEDRILKLEATSPEYFYIPVNALGSNKEAGWNHKPIRKRVYSTADLNSKLIDLEHKLKRIKKEPYEDEICV